MLSLLAHTGAPPAPHDLWATWPVDPPLVAALAITTWAYRRGRIASGQPTRRGSAFAAALVAVTVALLSPLDAAAGALASAHMGQHVLLTLVAAPLLAASAPWGAIARGLPRWVPRTVAWSGQRLRLLPPRMHVLRHPVVVWLLHVGTVWLWHARVPYDAAIDHPVLHVVEHVSFLVTGVLLWQVVLRHPRQQASGGIGLLMVFALAVQGVFLSALLTFARQPWYDSYLATAAVWGLTPLDDQRLAGAIMWIASGAVHVGVALALLVRWLQHIERDGDTSLERV